MPESRVKKSLLNARINLTFYFLLLAITFFSRKIFLDALGADFIGLTGTLQSILGYLNLAELGVGSAIGYVLYKPLFEKNQDKINEIITVLAFLYRRIGFIILISGGMLALFLPYIYSEEGFGYPIIYFAYFSFLASSLIGYFANYKQILLGADQRNYVVTAYFQSANIIKVAIQMAGVYYTHNLYLWLTIELAFGIIFSLILNWKIAQVYPWLKSEPRCGKELFKKYPEVIKYTKQIFIHRIGGLVQNQSSPLILYAFTSLQMTTYYGNYTIIVTKANQLFANITNGMGAAVGNLIAEDRPSKTYAVYKELFSFNFWTTGVSCTGFYFLTEPFIHLWLGEKYILPHIILTLIVVNNFFTHTRGWTDLFINGYGLFWDVWAPIAECILFFIASITGGILYGFSGILLGSIFSQCIIIGIWKPYLLYHWGFKRNILHYWSMFGWHLLLAIIILIVLKYFLFWTVSINPYDSFFSWLKYSLIVVIGYATIYFLSLYLFTSGMRSLTHRFYLQLKRKIIQ